MYSSRQLPRLLFTASTLAPNWLAYLVLQLGFFAPAVATWFLVTLLVWSGARKRKHDRIRSHGESAKHPSELNEVPALFIDLYNFNLTNSLDFYMPFCLSACRCYPQRPIFADATQTIIKCLNLSARRWFKSFAYCAGGCVLPTYHHSTLSVIEELTTPRLAKPDTALAYSRL